MAAHQNTTETPADGNLPAARRRYTNAATALTAPQTGIANNKTHQLDSRYDQLRQAISGRKNEDGIPGHTTTPIWTDALDLLITIDRTINHWHPQPATNYEAWFGTPHPNDKRTRPIRQLTAIEHRKWRPQDTHTLNDYSAQLEKWCKTIDDLLSGETNGRPLRQAACPACGTLTVPTHTTTGEPAQRPALHVTTYGCICLACKHRWAPAYLWHLSRVIGCTTPTGVLE